MKIKGKLVKKDKEEYPEFMAEAEIEITSEELRKQLPKGYYLEEESRIEYSEEKFKLEDKPKSYGVYLKIDEYGKLKRDKEYDVEVLIDGKQKKMTFKQFEQLFEPKFKPVKIEKLSTFLTEGLPEYMKLGSSFLKVLIIFKNKINELVEEHNRYREERGGEKE